MFECPGWRVHIGRARESDLHHIRWGGQIAGLTNPVGCLCDSSQMSMSRRSRTSPWSLVDERKLGVDTVKLHDAVYVHG